MTKGISIVLIFISLCTASFGQVSINTDTPDSNTDLTLGSTDKGFLPNKVKLESYANPTPLDSNIKDGTIVYNENGNNKNMSRGLYIWQDNAWNHLITSSNKRQDVGLMSYKQTADKDQITIPYGKDVLLEPLSSSFTVPRDGDIFIGTIIYVKMSISNSQDYTILGNTFFRIQVTDKTDNVVYNFMSACTPISTANNKDTGNVNNNPSTATSTSVLKVKENHTYEVKIYGQEGWQSRATVVAGTYSWRTYKSYSVVKVDFVSDFY